MRKAQIGSGELDAGIKVLFCMFNDVGGMLLDAIAVEMKRATLKESKPVSENVWLLSC